jgi:hypothetical protein
MLLGSIAHIQRSNLAYMAKELEAYRLEAANLSFYWF